MNTFICWSQSNESPFMLIEREGEIALREEIKQKLWPNDTVVEFEHGINNTIKNLRRAG